MPDETVIETTTVQEKRSTEKTIAWIVMAFVLALWVFVVFFFDGILANLARERLIEAVASGTHGEYQLSFTAFTYHRGVVTATGTDVHRIAYRANEYGTTLRKLGIDSAQVTGVSWWDVIFGKPIIFSTFRTYRPNAYLCDFAQGKSNWKLLPPYKPVASSPSTLSLTVTNVSIPNVVIYGQLQTKDIPAGTFSFNASDLNYNAKSNAPLNLTSKGFDLDVPWVQYSDSGTLYLVRAARVTSADSLLTIDTFAYASGSSTTAFRGSGIRATHLGFVRMLNGKGLSLDSLVANTYAASFTTGSSQHSQDSGLSWQDQLARSAKFPIAIKSIALNGGALDLHLDTVNLLTARGLSLHAVGFDFDSGAPSNQPGFARQFALSASNASYRTKSMGIASNNFATNISDSLITAGNILYYPSASGKKNAPIEAGGVRADGIDFDSLLAGRAVFANAIHTTSWKISGLPTTTKSKSKSKSKKASNAIWDAQANIAKTVSIPIRVNSIDLRGGSMHVTGPTTILAEGASVEAVGFDLDSAHAASKQLFFSKDVNVGAAKFHFADKGSHNIVDFRSAHTRLSRRSISAASAKYTSRSSFEPAMNNTSYRLNDMDFTGIDIAGLLDNKRIVLQNARARSWEIDRSYDTITKPPSSTASTSTNDPSSDDRSSGWKLPIIVGAASFPNGTVLFKERDTAAGGFSPTLQSKITKLEVTRFHFLPPKKKRPRLGVDQIVCVMPSFSFIPLDKFNTAEIRNLNANFKDSIITMDSLGYIPKYSEDEFNARHTYEAGRTDFRMANVRVIGIDARRMINGGGIEVNRFVAPFLWVDYYRDTRKPANPNPPPTLMPNEIVRSLNIPITVNRIYVNDGHITIRERTASGEDPGNFTFDSIRVLATPITFDSASPLIDTPTRFRMSGVFIAQAKTDVTLIYPLHDSAFNLSVDGTMGAFDLTQLNQYLVNAEHVQVMSGQFHHADIKMDIKDGQATTFVEPLYDHFKLKVLPPRPNDKPDIEEGVKTFVANTFILRDDDPDEKGGPPITATTTLAYQKSDAFFQFLWYSIRQSLGTVVGGFK